MRVTSSRHWDRVRPLIALVTLVAWFGTLLVVGPRAASAAPADPSTLAVSGPSGTGIDATPTWTFTLPADSTEPTAVPPGVVVAPSDTATATIATTHRGECFAATAAPTGPGDYVACTTPTGNPNQYEYSSPTLTAEGTYRFYVHDVETQTTTTTIQHADGSPDTVVPGAPSSSAGSDAVSAPYTLDLTGPSLAFTAEPTSPGTTPNVTWSWTATDAVTVACSFTDGATTTTPTCSTSHSETLTANGSYTLTVTATDAFGRTDVITSTYVLQSAPAPTVSGPSVGSTTTPTFTLSPATGTTPTAYSVVLTPPGGPAGSAVTVAADGTGTASYQPTLDPATEGTWTVSATVTVDGRPSAAGTATYRLDQTAPTVSILPATSTAANSSPTPGWTVTAGDGSNPAPTVTCAVTPTPSPNPGSSCAAYQTWSAPSEGTWTLTATAVDAAGNTDTDASSFTYDVPPGAPVVTLPQTTGNGPTASWTVSTQAGATVTCVVTDSSNATYATPTCAAGPGVTVTVTLPAGPGIEEQYVLHVTASDGGGTSATTDSAPYLLDRVPPPTPTFGAGGSTGSQNVATAAWPFTASGGTIVCRLVQGPGAGTAGAPLTCAASYTLPSPGEWWLRVTVTDAAGNTSSADSAHVVYDISNPDAPTLTRTTSSPTSDPATSWTIGTTETSGATRLCTWSGPSYTTTEAACAATYAFSLPATNGTYTLSVVIRDAAGNRSDPTTGSVLLDDIAPVVTFVSAPTSPRQDPAVTWTTTVAETGSGSVTTECRLMMRTSGADDEIEPWSTAGCGRTVTRTLSAGDGLYYLQVRDTDAAGNVNPNGTASADVELDTTAPGAPTVTGSAGFSQNPNASWTITPPAQADPTAVYDCRLVKDNVTAGTSWVPCDSDPLTAGIVFAVTLSTDGTYVVQVVARDPSGNLSTPVAASTPYTLDRIKPAAPSVSTLVYESNNTAPVWTISGEPNATFTCTWTTTISPVPTGMPAGGACATGYQRTLPADGLYTLRVTQTDQALNTSATSTDRDYLLDTLAPAAPVVTGPAGPSKNTSVSYSFTSEAGSAAQCRLTYVPGLTAGSPAPIGAGTWTTCTTPWSVTLDQGDGRYRAEVRLTDVATNVSTVGVSSIYVLDTTGPAAPVFTDGPSGADNVAAVSWTWTSESLSTATCAVDLVPAGSTTSTRVVAPEPCNTGTYGTTLSAGDGTYTLTVTLTDQYSNLGGSATSVPYTLDLTAPGAPTVTGPSVTSNVTTATYGISGPVESGATAECQLLLGTTVVSTWAPCTLPRTVSLGADGSYVQEIRLTDQYGNVGPAGSSPAYLLDTKLPTVPVVTAPPSPSASAAPVFTIVIDSDTTASCSLARGTTVVGTAACAGSYTGALDGLADGEYVLTVVSTDAAGNLATGVSGPYTYDTTAPVAPSVTGPTGPSQNRNPVFSWTGEPGAGAECSLQEEEGTAGVFAACVTPYAPALPTDGTWVLTVRLKDSAGNVSASGASGGYLLDTTAPPTPIVTAPSSPGRDLAPSWSAAIEDGSRADCRFSGPSTTPAFAPCTFPLTTPVGADGTYQLDVRTTDAAGNISPTGTGTYVLDTTAPAAPVVTQPTGPSRNRAPAIAFTAEAGTAGSCRLTRGSTVLSDSAPCSSPASLDLTGLPDGAYTLSVRAVDAAGNVGPAGTATYVLDTTAPAAPTMTLVAGSPSSDRAPVYGFTVEAGSTPVCRLTTAGGAIRDLTCTSPLTLDLSGSIDGEYVLAVTARDAAGNTSAAANSTYVLDGAAPAAPRVVGPVTPGSSRTPSWRITSSAPAECRLVRGTTVLRDWAPCGTTYTADLFAQPDGVYLLEARVVGTTAATTSRYRLDTAGPAAAVITAPPSPSTVRTPTWAVASPEVSATAECRVSVFGGVMQDWTACGVSAAGSLFSIDLTGLGDGTYTLSVRLTDSAGNVGAIATSDYVLDTSAPAAVGVVGPPSPGNDTTPTWTLNSTTGAKLECRVTSGQKLISDFAPCAGTFTADLTGLPDGAYTLTVHALSAAGTPGPDTTSSYLLDTTASDAPGTLTGPTGPSRDRAPTWTFVVPSGSTAMCRVTSGGKVYSEGPCRSPFTLDLSNAPDGSYTLTVRAVDAAGNLGPASTAGYILRTVPAPAPVFTQIPGSPSSTTDPRWGFTTVRGVTAECRILSNGVVQDDWSPCTSPYTMVLTGKPDGKYTLQVRSRDLAGNTSGPVASDYTFDRSAEPLAVFLETPVTPGIDLTPTWVVAAPAATAPTTAPALLRVAALTGTPTTQCRLTTPRGTGQWEACSGRYTATTTGDGTYLLEVRATDSAGTTGPASSAAYVLDTDAPDAPRFTETPPPVGNEAEISWSWADDPELLVECRFLRGSAPSSWAACTSPYTASLGRLGQNTYTLEARAVDMAGNISAVSATSYRYDTTPPPQPVFVSRPPARGTSSSATWTFAVPVDTSAVCVVTRDGTVVSEGACNGSFTIERMTSPATWSLSVRYIDGAGNVGPSAVGTYTLTTSVLVRDRVDGPAAPGGSPFTPRTPNGGLGTPTGGGPAAPVGPSGPTFGPEPGQPRAGGALPGVTGPVKRAVRNAVKAIPIPPVPGLPEGTRVPDAIKNTIKSTITKPQLPLALFIIVLLFLLVQNRIDRRDPKLAAAPVTAEPELEFGPRVMTMRTGGATA